MRARGFTLIELMVALVVLAVLVMTGVPTLTEYIQNTQIRNAAEAVQNGLQTARAEAVRRNTLVRFALVRSTDPASVLLDDTCDQSATGIHWIISRNDPSGACGAAPVTDFLDVNDAAQPQILQKRAAAEGSRNAQMTAQDINVATPVIVFNGLGRPSGGVGITRIDITNPKGGACRNADGTGGPMRCLRVAVSRAGDVRLCDPIVDAADTRACPDPNRP